MPYRVGSVRASARRCPRCPQARLHPRSFGETRAERCERCGGVWIETRPFNDLVLDIGRQSALLEAVSPDELVDDTTGDLRCLRCDGVMPRRDFARDTGVFVNACRRHGMWLDRGELRLVVELIGTVGARGLAAGPAMDHPGAVPSRKSGWLEPFLETLVDVFAWLNRTP